ncbi:calcium-binding protein [Microvirga mediterraneensis]|uniref:Calcium-binding protein n=1 Tax=Microvirga mediterraneensis TaxID=2754695 RepID=A0A838BIZ7_9HYPH|nr:calcium-binding protein [Microvirga mediterraneensis]MBA1155470.1 calcium-binding protein [Microvirga mediterraneensis]
MTLKIWGTEDVVRTLPGVSPTLPSITALPNGSYVVMWLEGGTKFAFQLYNGNGDAMWAEPQVVAAASSETPRFATVEAIGSEGRFAVTWSEGGVSNVSLYSRTYDPNGGSPTATVTVANGTGKSGAQMASNATGGWGTAYIDNGNVVFREFNSSGDPVGNPVPVAIAGASTGLDVTWLGGAKYIVAYQSNNGSDLYVVNGTTVSNLANLASVVAMDVVALRDPATHAPTGEFYVINDNGTTITAQKINSGGDNVGGPILIANAKPNSDFDCASAVALKTGGIALAYIAADPAAGDLGDVYITVIDASGNVGQPLKVNGRNTLDSFMSQRTPTISEMADGRLSISWYDPTSSAGNGDNLSTTIVDARTANISVTGTSGDDIYAPSEYADDTLDGGNGIDTLTFQAAGSGVAVDLTAGVGTAGIAAGDTYTNFERVIGSNFADTLTGGNGASTLQGGAGDDVYFVKAGTTLVETAGGGTDTVYSDATYTLAAHLENLFATGTNAINLTGNESDNLIVGNEANNQLIGGGGNDTLRGASGDDNLDGGNGNDVLDGGAGADALAGGAGNDNLSGGDGNDRLDGGDGDDVINGGAGADVMVGGAGNDVYYIDDVNDQIVDGAGVDTVYLAVSYDIARLGTIENITGIGAIDITLTGNDGNNVFTGNDGANILYGNAGNDILNGGAGNDRIHGGDGNDILMGGTGRDIFVFDKKPHKSNNVDRISDFNVADDSIYLENKYFKVTPSGTLTKPKQMAGKHFYKGAKAHDADDRIIYDNKKGILYYDADGNGAAAQVKIATLSKNLKMTYKDFFVI